jgi:hypothetical protein
MLAGQADLDEHVVIAAQERPALGFEVGEYREHPRKQSADGVVAGDVAVRSKAGMS